MNTKLSRLNTPIPYLNTTTDIIRHRLWNQQLTQTKFKEPHQLVAWLGAMQAQEYAMAKWAIGLHLPHLKESDVEKSFDKGKILRTHILRPTWHFVSPDDIRWMLKLTAPRVNAASAFMFRKMELTDAIFKKSNDIFTKVLRDKSYLTRNVLRSAVEEAKIKTDYFRLSYLLIRAELDGIICSGPREGNQFTYALLEERVAAVKALTRDEALARLTSRYFDSRGPATIHDFSTWSGLTIKDAKEGTATLPSRFLKEVMDGKEYFFPDNKHIDKATIDKTFLIPDFDEYGMGYKDRSAIFNDQKLAESVSRGNPIFNRMIIINGKIEGSWKRRVKKKETIIDIFPFLALSKQKMNLLNAAENRYKSFIGGSIDEMKD